MFRTRCNLGDFRLFLKYFDNIFFFSPFFHKQGNNTTQQDACYGLPFSVVLLIAACVLGLFPKGQSNRGEPRDMLPEVVLTEMIILLLILFNATEKRGAKEVIIFYHEQFKSEPNYYTQ